MTRLGNIDTSHYRYTPESPEWFYDVKTGKQYKVVNGKRVERT